VTSWFGKNPNKTNRWIVFANT